MACLPAQLPVLRPRHLRGGLLGSLTSFNVGRGGGVLPTRISAGGVGVGCISPSGNALDNVVSKTWVIEASEIAPLDSPVTRLVRCPVIITSLEFSSGFGVSQFCSLSPSGVIFSLRVEMIFFQSLKDYVKGWIVVIAVLVRPAVMLY